MSAAYIALMRAAAEYQAEFLKGYVKGEEEVQRARLERWAEYDKELVAKRKRKLERGDRLTRLDNEGYWVNR